MYYISIHMYIYRERDMERERERIQHSSSAWCMRASLSARGGCPSQCVVWICYKLGWRFQQRITAYSWRRLQFVSHDAIRLSEMCDKTWYMICGKRGNMSDSGLRCPNLGSRKPYIYIYIYIYNMRTIISITILPRTILSVIAAGGYGG